MENFQQKITKIVEEQSDEIKMLQQNPDLMKQFMAMMSPQERQSVNQAIEIINKSGAEGITVVPEETKGDSVAQIGGNLNGSDASQSWAQPIVSVQSNKLARTDVEYSKTKTEFRDSKDVLNAKLKFVADKMKRAKKVVIYSGAGISTASGIADIASKKKIARNSMNRLQAQPTKAHHAIVAMYGKNYIHNWVTQNHDGLAQKAGMPLADVNEIHGGWFDKYNIVKMMDDDLDPKKLKQLHEWQEEADVVIACGSSLSGLNADSIAKIAGEHPDKTLVIINNQETRLHDSSQINIFCDINVAFVALAKLLNVVIPKNPRVYEPAEFIKEKPRQTLKKVKKRI